MTDEELLDKIDAWHFDGAGEDMTLHDYLGWTWEEYKEWVMTGVMPNESI